MAAIEDQVESLNISEEDVDAVNALSYRGYFRIYEENGKAYSECLVENCPKKKLAGKQKYNLERHLGGVHKINTFKIEKKLPTNAEISLKIKMSPATIYRAWIESVAVNGRIIGCMNDSGTKLLLDPYVEAFEKAGVKIDVSIPTLKSYLTKYADTVKSEIRKEVEGIIIHVKLDLASRMRKSILGVNIQYMKDDKIVVRTLSMLQTNSSHTGEYICSLLMQILDEFNIKYSQVHTITTDNGKNVVKSVELFRAVENADLMDDTWDELNILFDEENENNSNDEDENGADDEDVNEMERIVNNAISIFEAKSEILTAIKCAAHTVQLVVQGGLKNTDYAKKLLRKCRRIVRTLLNPNMMNLIRQQNLNSPKIDCLTRWSSTYYMLERLVYLKEFYEQVISFMPSNCKLNDADWQALDGILSTLKLFESLTKKLQAVQFTVSDFYAAWVELKCELESFVGIALVDNILDEMRKREKEFLQNDVVYSCVYIDARYQVLLSAGNSCSLV